MTPATVMVVIVATWCLIGIVVLIGAARRGHALVTWAWLGALLGSVATELAHGIGLPVLVGGADARADDAPGRLATSRPT